ncbi:MAG: Fur family transcriptional regulator [Deltaproteobacteria bacterium DG_8]|nr:MAG: Fur family transcriptional regulator [Deltaproteobacteria bacterium DG_8]
MKVQIKKVEKIFTDYLGQKHLKYTQERKVILKEIFSIHNHFEADELYLRLRQKSNSKISRATVYRTLPLLEESGLIRRVIFIDKHTHYEQVYGHKHHEHLICIECGKIIDFYRKSLEDALEDVARENEFESVAHKLEITGYCKNCKKG